MDLSLKWIGGATWVLEIENTRIACDPVLCPAGTIQDYFWFKSKRIEDPVYTARDFESIDLWLITHHHDDHIDDYGIKQIGPEADVVTHKNALSKLQRSKSKKISILEWGEKKSFEINDLQITIEAMPAVHGVSPVSAFFAGGVNGYWMTLENESETISIYVPSDTVTRKVVLDALHGRKADLFIPNVGAAKKGSWMMTLTLSAKMMKEIKDIIRPEITIPTHFGTFEHYAEPVSKIEKLRDKTIRILKPGETFEFQL